MSLFLLGLGFPILAMIFRLPWRVIPIGFILYWAVGLTAHLLLAADHPICLWFGGSWQSWAATGSIGLVIFLYVRIVGALKKNARQVAQ